ncbi:hypothetical protein [Tolypothrix sp. VBCCA 56010]
MDYLKCRQTTPTQPVPLQKTPTMFSFFALPMNWVVRCVPFFVFSNGDRF